MARRVLVSLVRVIAALLLTVASMVLHLPSHAGRAALRDIAAALLPTLVPGRLVVGSVDRLSLAEVRLSGVSYADERGAPLLGGATVTVRPAWRLWGAIVGGDPYPEIVVHARTAWARVPFFTSATPAAAGSTEAQASTPAIRLPSVRVTVDEIRGALPGVQLDGRALGVDVGLTVAGETTIDLRRLGVTLDVMDLRDERVEGGLRLVIGEPMRLDGTVRLRGPSLNCDVRASTDAAGRISTDLRGCGLSADALDLLAGRSNADRLGLGLHIEGASLEAAADGQWNLRASARANGELIELTGRVSGASQTVDVRVRHLSMRRVLATAPDTDLDGTIHVERHVQGTSQRFVVDTSRLTAVVAGAPVPPMRATLRLDGTQLTIEQLTSPDVGLTARGVVDIEGGASNFRADMDIDAPEIARYPWVAGRASGALRLRAHLVGSGGRITGEVHATTQRLRAMGIRMATASVDATGAFERGEASIDATVTARQLVVPGAFGPANVSVQARGDPLRRLRARVFASGDGLLAALGPAPSVQSGPTSARVEVDLDLTDPTRIHARLADSTIVLRGARARVSGELAVSRGGSAGAIPTGRVRVVTEGHGSVTLDLARRRASAELHAFDLSWLRPLAPGVAGLEGLVEGSLSVDPDNLRGARVDVRIQRGRFDPIGAFNGSLEVAPSGAATGLRLVLESGRGAPGAARQRAEITLQVVVPRRTDDADAWVAGVRSGRVSVDNVDLGVWNDLMPVGLGAQGRVRATVDLTRAAPSEPLQAEAHVEARNLAAGLRVAGRLLPAAVPMTLRVVACTELRDASLVGTSARLRVAMAPWRSSDPEPEARPCATNEPLLPRSLLAVDWSARGPWLSATRDAIAELRAPLRRLSPATQARLADTTIDLRARVGPFLRSEWPLRTIPIRGADGAPRMLAPPPIPADAQMMVEATAAGPALGLGLRLEGEFHTSSLAQAGLTEPFTARLFADLRPAARGTLLGAVRARLDGSLELSPNAPPPERGNVAIALEAHGDGAGLVAGAEDGVTFERFEVDSTNVLLERFAWARERGMRGAVELRFAATDNAAAPVEAWARVRGFRARIGDAEDARETPPVQAYVGARMLQRDGGGWTLNSCAHATASAGTPTCDPLASAAVEADGSLVAHASIPVLGTLLRPRPRIADADLQLVARRFRLETLTPLVRDDNLAGIGGSLEATVRWSGRHPEALFGDLRISDGRAELIALGEPLRDLALNVRVEGPAARISAFSAALGRGRVDLTGTADLSGLASPRREGAEPAAAARAATTPAPPLVNLHLQGETRQLPVGVEGNTYGWIDSTIRYDMAFGAEGASGVLNVASASVLLKEEQSRELQPLAIDRDVFILGRTVRGVDHGANSYPIEVRFDTETPVWIRRSDLAVALRAHAEVHRERAGWGVAGTIELANNQSWFSVLGKRFELARSRVVFDGGVAINPQLDVLAHHDSNTLGRLTATVGGRLRGPSMVFGAVNYPDATQAEILAMIALGRRDSQGASNDSGGGDLGEQAGTQFASLITAFTLGTVNAGLSRTTSFMPTIILEPGQGATSGRYGAGVALGPRFYLQATYGAASNALGQVNNTAQMFRVLLEIALSQSISTSVFGDVGRSEGGAQGSAGFDVFWSP